MCSVKRTYWLVFLVLVVLIGSMLPLVLTRTAQAEENKSNLEELIANADSVIEGTVIEHTSYWNDEHNRIYTSVVLAVEEKFKGTLGQKMINVILPGGNVDGVGQWLSDMPAFDQSERAIVFLNKLPKEELPKVSGMQFTEDQFEVYGGFRGKVAIRQGKVGDLPEAIFKERIRKASESRSLSPGELDVPSSQATFPYTYSGYSWPHPPNPAVVYKINENTADCTGEGATALTAAATWNAAGAGFSFSYSGSTTATTYSRNGVNEILWNNLGSGGTIGHTIIWYSGGTILENDIEFNDYYSWSTAASCPAGRMDVETIALHELGHWLCLSDLYNAEDAAKVMYGYGSTGTTKRVLHSDDIAGIRSIYGAVTSAPAVTNSIGASDVTSNTATLNGEVTSTGGENPTVHICWGTTDGGTTAASWTHDENLGVKGTGAFQKDITGLNPGTTYYYRCYATNSAGTAWAATATSFTTTISSGSWLTGWNYRKRITIAGSADGAQANYQMKLTINRSIGTDSGSTVYVGAKCASDYKDIRFTKTDGITLLDYWIESLNSGTATVWIEFDSMPASPDAADICMYYGNLGALAASSGSNTFPFFDHFDDNSLDTTTKWQVTAAKGSYSESGTELTVTAGAGSPAFECISSKTATYGAGYALRSRVKSTTDKISWLAFVTTRGTTSAVLVTTCFRKYSADTNFVNVSGSGTNYELPNTGIAKDTTYRVWEVRRLSGVDDAFYANDAAVGTGQYDTTTARYIDIFSYHQSGNVVVDWVLIRKYTANEPTWGAWGSEEPSGGGGVTAPAVTNGTGASSVTTNAATLNGEVPSTGGENPTVHICWGTTDGGTTVANWAHDENLGVKGAGAFQKDITGLNLGTTYHYRCYATNSADTAWANTSATFQTTTFEAPTPLSPGTNITFKWSSSTGATKYYLQVSTSSSFTSTVFSDDVGNVTTYEVTGLTLGTNYYWRVRAGNDAGWGAYSATGSVTASIVP
jgi:hypothetical protein